MPERSAQAYLRDIIEACRRVCSYTSNISYEEFLADAKTQDAVIRNIEIIGEAIKQLPESLTEQHSSIP